MGFLGFQGHRWGRTQADGAQGPRGSSPTWDIHQIDTDGAGRCGQHGSCLNLVVIADDAGGRQIDEGCGHNPDREDRGQCTQCLCGIGPISTHPGHGGPMESHRAVPLSSPERCQPKVMVLVGGRLETQREKRLTDMLPMSVSRWAASVMMARLCARYPPVGTEQLVPHAPPAAPHPGPAPITYHLPDHEEAADSTGDAQLLVGLEPALPRAGGWGAAAAVESCSRGGRQCRGVSRACEETRGGGHCRQHWIWCSCPEPPSVLLLPSGTQPGSRWGTCRTSPPAGRAATGPAAAAGGGGTGPPQESEPGVVRAPAGRCWRERGAVPGAGLRDRPPVRGREAWARGSGGRGPGAWGSSAGGGTDSPPGRGLMDGRYRCGQVMDGWYRCA